MQISVDDFASYWQPTDGAVWRVNADPDEVLFETYFNSTDISFPPTSFTISIPHLWWTSKRFLKAYIVFQNSFDSPAPGTYYYCIVETATGTLQSCHNIDLPMALETSELGMSVSST